MQISEDRLRELEDWDTLVQEAEKLPDEGLQRLYDTLHDEARRAYWQADRLKWIIAKRREAHDRDEWYRKREET